MSKNSGNSLAKPGRMIPRVQSQAKTVRQKQLSIKARRAKYLQAIEYRVYGVIAQTPGIFRHDIYNWPGFVSATERRNLYGKSQKRLICNAIDRLKKLDLIVVLSRHRRLYTKDDYIMHKMDLDLEIEFKEQQKDAKNDAELSASVDTE